MQAKLAVGQKFVSAGSPDFEVRREWATGKSPHRQAGKPALRGAMEDDFAQTDLAAGAPRFQVLGTQLARLDPLELQYDRLVIIPIPRCLSKSSPAQHRLPGDPV